MALVSAEHALPPAFTKVVLDREAIAEPSGDRAYEMRRKRADSLAMKRSAPRFMYCFKTRPLVKTLSLLDKYHALPCLTYVPNAFFNLPNESKPTEYTFSSGVCPFLRQR